MSTQKTTAFERMVEALHNARTIAKSDEIAAKIERIAFHFCFSIHNS